MTTPDIDIAWDPAKARINQAKHGVSFAQAATVLEDPVAITVFDALHSDQEDRWFTLGRSRQGTLLAIAHTYRVLDDQTVRVRLISARPATRRERTHYQHSLHR